MVRCHFFLLSSWNKPLGSPFTYLANQIPWFLFSLFNVNPLILTSNLILTIFHVYSFIKVSHPACLVFTWHIHQTHLVKFWELLKDVSVVWYNHFVIFSVSFKIQIKMNFLVVVHSLFISCFSFTICINLFHLHNTESKTLLLPEG